MEGTATADPGQIQEQERKVRERDERDRKKAAKAAEQHPNGSDPGLEGERAEDQPPPELVIDAGGQIGMTIGGRKPDHATLTIVGGRIQVDGEFKKGQIVTLTDVRLRISAVEVGDRMEGKTDSIASTGRHHKARFVTPPVVKSVE